MALFRWLRGFWPRAGQDIADRDWLTDELIEPDLFVDPIGEAKADALIDSLQARIDDGPPAAPWPDDSPLWDEYLKTVGCS